MILIPTINPIRFSLDGINEPATEKAYYREYHQKYRRADVTALQILVPDNEEKDWQLTVQNDTETVMPYTFPRTLLADVVTGYTLINFAIDFSQFAEGLFRFTLAGSSPVKYYSDWLCVRNDQPYTRLLSYRNSHNTQNVMFDTGIVFHIRVETQCPQPTLNAQFLIPPLPAGSPAGWLRWCWAATVRCRVWRRCR